MDDLDFPGLLRHLDDFGVEFLVIGGLAVNYHGYVRATKDLDITPAPDRENLERLAAALIDLEAETEGSQDFDPDELPDPTDIELLVSGGNWLLNTRLGRLDLLQWIGDQSVWERFAADSEVADIDGQAVRVIGYSGLLAMKRDAGRPEDLVDIQKMEAARQVE